MDQTLTPREEQILKLICAGNSITQIAITLDISPRTVDAHRWNIRQKLHINNTAQLVIYAIKKGIYQIQ